MSICHRHLLYQFVGWFLTLFFTAFAGQVSAADKAAPPNVVMIVGDDMGWTDFGFMGSKVVQTPHLDKLAAQSAVFPHGYVPTSLCRASLATLLTGLYGHEHKICCNDPPEGIDRTAMHPFIKNAPTVPRLLGQGGYRSLQTGKFWEGHYENAGFTAGMTVKGRHGDDGLVIGRQTMKPIYDFIEADQQKPFFIWYAPMMPHTPHNPPERLLKKYLVDGRNERLAKYYAMCEWFDETCGELLGYLDQKGLRDKTLVVFVVDNGWVQDTGPGPQTSRGGARGKLSPYDGGLRTPVLFRWPGHTKAGRYHDLVSTIDLAPTILEAAGVKVPRELPGLSLLEIAAGQGCLIRQSVFGEIFVHTAVNLEKPALNLTHRWVREGDWKLILPEKGPAELYNVAKDPHEERNVAGANAERVRQMTQLILEWWNSRAQKE